MRRGLVPRSHPVATPCRTEAAATGRVTPSGGAVRARPLPKPRSVTAYSAARMSPREDDTGTDLRVGAAAAPRRARLDLRAVRGRRRPAANGPRWPGRLEDLQRLALRRDRHPRRHDVPGARAPRSRRSLGLDRGRDLRVDVRRHLLHLRPARTGSAAVSVLRRRRLSRVLRPGVRRARPARPLVGGRLRRCRLARRPDRRVHHLCARHRPRARAGVALLHGQLRGRRHEPRLPVGRRVAARPGLRRLRALRLAAEPDVAARRDAGWCSSLRRTPSTSWRLPTAPTGTAGGSISAGPPGSL